MINCNQITVTDPEAPLLQTFRLEMGDAMRVLRPAFGRAAADVRDAWFSDLEFHMQEFLAHVNDGVDVEPLRQASLQGECVRASEHPYFSSSAPLAHARHFFRGKHAAVILPPYELKIGFVDAGNAKHISIEFFSADRARKGVVFSGKHCGYTEQLNWPPLDFQEVRDEMEGTGVSLQEIETAFAQRSKSGQFEDSRRFYMFRRYWQAIETLGMQGKSESIRRAEEKNREIQHGNVSDFTESLLVNTGFLIGSQVPKPLAHILACAFPHVANSAPGVVARARNLII